MDEDEAIDVLRGMMHRREDRCVLLREAAEQMRAYAFGLPSAAKRSQALSIADQYQADATRGDRCVQAMAVAINRLEDDNGRRGDDTEGEDAAAASDTRGAH